MVCVYIYHIHTHTRALHPTACFISKVSARISGQEGIGQTDPVGTTNKLSRPTFQGFIRDRERLNSELPNWGREKGDLFRFAPISPFSSDVFRFTLLVFRKFVPICSDLLRFSSDLFRFIFRTNQSKSGKPLSADPFKAFANSR